MIRQRKRKVRKKKIKLMRNPRQKMWAQMRRMIEGRTTKREERRLRRNVFIRKN